MAIDKCLAFHASTFYSIKSITLEREETFFMIYMSVHIVSLNILNKPVLRIKKKILPPDFK